MEHKPVQFSLSGILFAIAVVAGSIALLQSKLVILLVILPVFLFFVLCWCVVIALCTAALGLSARGIARKCEELRTRSRVQESEKEREGLLC